LWALRILLWYCEELSSSSQRWLYSVAVNVCSGWDKNIMHVGFPTGREWRNARDTCRPWVPLHGQDKGKRLWREGGGGGLLARPRNDGHTRSPGPASSSLTHSLTSTFTSSL
jgi:hypothetical protein